EAMLLRARALVEQANYTAAAAELDRVAVLEPDSAPTHHLRGQIALKQGRYEQAIANLSAVLMQTPDGASALFLRGCANQFLERHDEALADLHQAVLRDPSYTSAYCNQRAWVHVAAGNYELALADYGIVLQLDPLDVTALAGKEEALKALQN